VVHTRRAVQQCGDTLEAYPSVTSPPVCRMGRFYPGCLLRIDRTRQRAGPVPSHRLPSLVTAADLTPEQLAALQAIVARHLRFYGPGTPSRRPRWSQYPRRNGFGTSSHRCSRPSLEFQRLGVRVVVRDRGDPRVVFEDGVAARADVGDEPARVRRVQGLHLDRTGGEVLLVSPVLALAAHGSSILRHHCCFAPLTSTRESDGQPSSTHWPIIASSNLSNQVRFQNESGAGWPSRPPLSMLDASPVRLT
jgi:hypothetical protein